MLNGQKRNPHMIQKTALVAALLIVLVAACAGAVQVQIMVGLFVGFMPAIEITVLTPPAWLGAYQQEIGLRLISVGIFTNFDLVLRSWLSFPDGGSDFLRQRFRCGIEYSPTLYYAMIDDYEGWLQELMAKTGLCASIRIDDPSTVTTTDLFLSAPWYWSIERGPEWQRHRGKLEGWWYPWPLAGIALRSRDW